MRMHVTSHPPHKTHFWLLRVHKETPVGTATALVSYGYAAIPTIAGLSIHPEDLSFVRFKMKRQILFRNPNLEDSSRFETFEVTD